MVMKAKVVSKMLDAEREEADARIEVYMEKYGAFNASCYVHEEIGSMAAEEALDRYPDAILLVHPECGCANECLRKLNCGLLPADRVYHHSTEQMIRFATTSSAKQFVVATEKGIIYRLRKELPGKEFIPISDKAECRYMKANTFEKLAASFDHDRYEVILCDDCCDPKHPLVDERTVHIPKSVAAAAKAGIDRMLAIQ